ncbi:ABC transporter ATP-binding protein [Microbacterium thalassium]|uniref:NitT/TauT family transport system ATP-binding protein n=1 Tax=Microbacterium thalassium TaxID=362649 RepID=A0A7X0KT79_9MICO|nr:ABC transporter ATP-binding protein [Microbacterium thalassium]MBB6389836.1 NitT/TauT family transport system ATP-binding protein [Microbacterium thalassium]GLK24524.1 ABC transporter [Microbacterium thalassium]
MSQQHVLAVEDLGKAYVSGETTAQILNGVDFAVDTGQFVCVVGPSGSGKTTLLKCIAGLTRPTSGQVVFEGETVTEPPAKLAVIFQDYSRSLLPWMTVEKNVELPLHKAKFPKAERAALVEEALVNVGLAGKGKLYPWEMSGGMQQRAAIARGLAYQPDVLLMDEPFAAVDAQTRIELEDLVLDMSRRLGMTVLFVTHDIDEAVYLGDRVIVLSGAPAQVARDIAVDLPAQRHQVETKNLPRFGELRAEVFDLIQQAKKPVTQNVRAVRA